MSDDITDIIPPEDFDKEVDDLFGSVKKQRKRKNVAIVVAGVAVAVSAVAAGVALESQNDNEDLARKVVVNGKRLDETNRILKEQRDQFELCKNLPKTDPRCQQPVAPPTPTATPEQPGATVKGVSESQVRDIVAAEVARRNLTLTPSQITTVATVAAKLVKPGRDGKTPTNAQLQPLVSAAVATFCANGACQGKDGADAPAVTQEQLTNTLIAYCQSRNDCIGTKGDTGAGIEDVNTVVGPDGVKVTMTFTDGRDPVSFVILNGKDGAPGYPFTFVFSVPGALPSDPETTYSCTVNGPLATDTTCTKQ